MLLMATRLSPLGIIAKWLLVPGALALIGYYFVGPRVGGGPSAHRPTAEAHAPGDDGKETTQIPDDATSLDEESPAPRKSFKEPDVDVSVSPARSNSRRSSSTRRRSSRAPAPRSETPTPSAEPQSDPAGTGGMTPPDSGTDG